MTLTCVSGYWEIKNKHGDKFNDWFHNTVQIKCPYVRGMWLMLQQEKPDDYVLARGKS